MMRSNPQTAETTAASVHLDALRGAAALLVFANHTRALYFASPIEKSAAVVQQPKQASPDPFGGEGGGTIRIASAAVIVFFVLSGYLVGGSVLRSMRSNKWSWNTYLAKRLVRLLIVLCPAILLGVSLDIIGSHIFGPQSIYTAPPGLHLMVSADLQSRLRPTVLLGNFLFLQNIIVPIEGTNVSLWSLANEFWYYLVFPLLASLFFPGFPKLLKLASALLAGLLLWFTGFSIAVLFPIWLMGALVSLLPTKSEPRSAQAITWIGVVLVLASILVSRFFDLPSVPAEYVIGLATSFLLYGIVQQKWPWRRSMQSGIEGSYRRISRFFSDISYSLYLFHLPIAVFLCAMVDSPWHSFQRAPRTVAWYVLSDCLIIGIVYGLWFLFEARTDVVRTRIFGVPSTRKGPTSTKQPLGTS